MDEAAAEQSAERTEDAAALGILSSEGDDPLHDALLPGDDASGQEERAGSRLAHSAAGLDPAAAVGAYGLHAAPGAEKAASAAEAAALVPALRRAEPIRSQLPTRFPWQPPPLLLPPPQQRQMQLPGASQQPQSLQHQRDKRPGSSAAGLQPTRSAVAAFLARLSPAEKRLLLSGLPQERLLQLLSSTGAGNETMLPEGFTVN